MVSVRIILLLFAGFWVANGVLCSVCDLEEERFSLDYDALSCRAARGLDG